MPKLLAMLQGNKRDRTRSRSRRSGLLGKRLALMLGALLAALLLAELVARLVVPADRYMHPNAVARKAAWAETQKVFATDPELGFVPILGRRTYDRFGVLRQSGDSSERVDGTPRLLFLGDSVTRRQTLFEPLHGFTAPHPVQLLNAGVESWNPEQEVAFYFRHQLPLAADHVVLSLHNNDFTSTSLCLLHEGRYTLCSHGSLVSLYPRLYRVSMLYRMVVHSRFVHGANPANYLSRAGQVEAALRRLQAEVAERGARLTVLLLPILAAEANQEEHELQARIRQLAMLQRLGVDFLDLQPVCEQLVRAGVEVRQDPSDPWHPNRECGAVLAAAAAHRLFEASPFEVVAMPRVTSERQRVTIRFGDQYAGREWLVRSAPSPYPADGFVDRQSGAIDAAGHARMELSLPAGTTPGSVVWFRAEVREPGREGALAITRPWCCIVPRDN